MNEKWNKYAGQRNAAHLYVTQPQRDFIMSYIGLLLEQEENDDRDNELRLMQEATGLRKELEAAKLELARAAQILNDAQGLTPHALNCKLGDFIRHHKAFPPSHPVWFGRPECSCWKREAGAFILKHANLSTLKV